MSDPRGILELLHGSGTAWETARLVVRRWGDSERAGAALRRVAEQHRSRGTASVVTARGAAGGEIWETVIRVWVDRVGDRRRTELHDARGESLTIRHGSLWWSYHPSSGSMSNESEPDIARGGGGNADVDWLLDPSMMLPAFDLIPIGRSIVAGRAAIEVRAVPRRPDPLLRLGTGMVEGADEVILAVDEDRGVVTRAESRLEGRPFSVTEVLEVSFDETFPPEFFRFASPDGSPIRSPREAFARPEPVSIEEAASRAAFTVLVPTRLPQGWAINASYIPASSRPARAESVTVRITSSSSEPRVRIHESAEEVRDSPGWEDIEHRGRRIRLLPRQSSDGAYAANVQVEGTNARVSGNVDRAAFVDIVASLAPAPRMLPPVVDH